MPRRRVLVNALSAGFGGSLTYLINFLREIGRDDRGFDFTVLTLPGALDRVTRHGVPVQEVRLPAAPASLRLPLRVAFEQLLLRRHARRHDLLYCLADVAPLACPVPVVVLMRNLNIYDRSWYDNPRTRALARLASLTAPRARRVLFPTRAAADQITSVIPLPEERVAVVPFGVDLEALGGEEAAEQPTSGRHTLFLPAAVERHKNIGVIVRALAELGAPWELKVVGGASPQAAHEARHQAELLALAREEGVASRVHFFGPVPYGALAGCYRSARALVFPSYIESFGHPLLEAMASGTPVIASDIPTFRELAGDAGAFFPVDDAAALAACVRELDADPEATQRRLAAGMQRAGTYTWARSVDRLCAVFDEVLGGP